VDRLADAGQSWWQSLPLGPTGYGNSPYQPLSSFAGNELLVSPDDLIEDELLCPNRVRRRCIRYDGCRLCGGDAVQAPACRVRLEQCRCWETRRLAARLGEMQRRPLPRMAGGVGRAQSCRSQQGQEGTRRTDRQVALCPVPALSAGESSQAVCE